MKVYKFRLYPTDAQVEKLDWTLARCCELYNAALQERKDAWNICKKHGNFYDPAWRKEHAKEYAVNVAEQCRSLTLIRNEMRAEYQQIGSHVLQNVLHRVDKACIFVGRSLADAGKDEGPIEYRLVSPTSKRMQTF